MKYSFGFLAILATIAVLWTPSTAQGQNKEIVALQRDMGDVQKRLDDLQKSQDAQMAQINALLKEMAANTKALSGDLQAIEHNLQQSLQKGIAEQQSRVADPIAGMRTGMDTMGQDLVAVRTDMTTLKDRTEKMAGAIEDLQAALRNVNTPAAPPPPSTAEAAESLFRQAERDYIGGNNDVALTALLNLVTTYPMSPHTPRAYLLAGLIYDRVKQYPDALQAFNTILELPESTTTPDAQFLKAETLEKMGNRQAAITEYETFLKKYPSDHNAASAQAKAAALRRAKGKSKN